MEYLALGRRLTDMDRGSRSLQWKMPPSMTWRAVDRRTGGAEVDMFRKSDGTFWLLTLVAAAGLFVAFFVA